MHTNIYKTNKTNEQKSKHKQSTAGENHIEQLLNRLERNTHNKKQHQIKTIYERNNKAQSKALDFSGFGFVRFSIVFHSSKAKNVD